MGQIVLTVVTRQEPRHRNTHIPLPYKGAHSPLCFNFYNLSAVDDTFYTILAELPSRLKCSTLSVLQYFTIFHPVTRESYAQIIYYVH